MIGNKSESISYRNQDSTSSGFLVRQTKLLMVILVAAFICLQVVITNLFSDNGRELRSLEARRQELVKKNEQSRGELARLGSLSRIQQEALNSLGMKAGVERLDFLVPPKLAVR